MLAIALALGASLCWGSGDFLGGFTSRRASLWAVIIGSQAVGLAAAAAVTFAAGHAWPGLGVVWPVLVGGVASVVGISSFYTALSIGTMSIVAPISATSALVPFVVGLAGGERPATAQLIGVTLAAAGVVLAAVESERPGEVIGVAALPNEPAVEPAAARRITNGRERPARPTRRDQRLSIALALLAALCIGIVLLSYDATSKHDPLWAMLGCRISSVTLFAMLFVALRPHVRMTRSAVPFVIAVGLLDTGANGLFALATTQGYLSLVAVLGSVYPVVTVMLAFVVLHERLARHQLAGVVAALVGVCLIAAG
jgi:drug/metabolite transporter (DMT)-like permease